MIDPAFRNELLRELEQLPSTEQRRVLAFVHALLRSRPRGASGSELLRRVGTITPEDAEAMQRAIEDGCERVDAESW
jgi:hypothetical protein